MILKDDDLDFEFIEEGSLATVVEKAYRALIHDGALDMPLSRDPSLPVAVTENVLPFATSINLEPANKIVSTYTLRARNPSPQTQQPLSRKRKATHSTKENEKLSLRVKHPRLTPEMPDHLQLSAEHKIPLPIFTLLMKVPLKFNAFKQLLTSGIYHSLIAQGISLEGIIDVLTKEDGVQNLKALELLVTQDRLSMFRSFGFSIDQLSRVLAQPLGFENLNQLQNFLESQTQIDIPTLNDMLTVGITIEHLTTLLAQPLGYKNFKKLIASWSVRKLERGSFDALQAAGFSPTESINMLAQPMGFNYFNAISCLVYAAKLNLMSTEQAPEKIALKKLVLNNNKAIAQIRTALKILKTAPTINQERLFIHLNQHTGQRTLMKLENMSLEELLERIERPSKQKANAGPDDEIHTVMPFQNKRPQKTSAEISEELEFKIDINSLFSRCSTDNTLPQPDVLLPNTFQEISPSIIQALQDYPEKIASLKDFYKKKSHSNFDRPLQLKEILMVLKPIGGSKNLTLLQELAKPQTKGQSTSLQELHNIGFTIDDLTTVLTDRSGSKHIHAWQLLVRACKENVTKESAFFDTLLTIEPENSGFFYNSSPLYWILEYKSARLIFEKLLENEKLISILLNHPLFLNALLARRPADTGKWANMSVFFLLAENLSNNPVILKIFNEILNSHVFKDQLKNPEFFQYFFDTLVARLPDTRGAYANLSALYFLTESENGIWVLRCILNNDDFKAQLNKPAFFQGFFDTLIARQPDSAGYHANLSGLYNLAETVNGVGGTLLKDILNNAVFNEQLKNPAFFQCFFATLLARQPCIAIAGKHANLSALYWLSRDDIGKNLLAAILSIDTFTEQLKTPMFFKHFFDALLARTPASAGKHTHRSALYWLSRDDIGKNLLAAILSIDTFTEQLKNPAFFQCFFDTLFARKSDSTYQHANSAFYCLSWTKLGTTILTITLNNDVFKEQLKNQAFCQCFFDTLLAREPASAGEDANTSALYLLSSSFEGTNLLTDILAIDTVKKYLQNPILLKCFLDTLLTRKAGDDYQCNNFSAFYQLSYKYQGRQILACILQNNTFENFLKEKKFFQFFLDTLLGRRPDIAGKFANLSAFYFLTQCPQGRKNLLTLLEKPEFMQQLLEHEEFFNTLLATATESFSDYNTSGLFYLIDDLPFHQEWLLNIFSHNAFISWIYKPHNLANMMHIMSAMTPFKSCIFSKLFSKGESGQIIFEKLMKHTLIKKAFFKQFKIPISAKHFWMKQLQTDATFFLFHALSKIERMSLLQHENLQTLFRNPHIQQLIRMNQIKAEWFLFIAANQPQYDAQVIEFFLAQDIISPWATNTAGHYLYNLIDGFSIAETDKIHLKSQFRNLLQQQALEYSKKSICIKLHDAPSLQEREELIPVSESTSLSDATEKTPSAFVLPAIRPFAKKEQDPMLDNTGMQQVNQYIDWILSQPKLAAFYTEFSRLSKNRVIIALQDHSHLLALLQRVCFAMHRAIEQNKPIMFYTDWNYLLSKCAQGVFDGLTHIYSIFSDEHPFKSYFENIIKTNIAYFNRLFDIPKNIETHAPQAMIHSLLGRTFREMPVYDPYLLKWSDIQQQWVAQSCAESLLHSENFLYEQIVQPILATLSEGLLVTDEQGIAHPVTEIPLKDLTEDHPLIIAKEQLNHSPLCDVPLSTPDFLELIFTSEDIKQKSIESIIAEPDGRIEIIDTRRINERLKITLQGYLTKWLSEDQQSGIPQLKIVNLFSQLLWQYLTQDHYNKAVTALLEKIPHATDAAALIKYCVISHQSQAHLIKLDRIFTPLSVKSPVSLFSLLIANPFYTEWLFGFEITVKRNAPSSERQPGAIDLQFNATPNALELTHALMQDENIRRLRDDALEAALIQPGALFFWLYYLQQDTLRQDLFKAIINFIFTQPNQLFSYDSLLPLLYDMQTSTTVAQNDKVLVRSFLEVRIEEQLKHEHSAYWQTSCYLVDNPGVIAQRTNKHYQQYPWLHDKDKQTETSNMARSFLLNLTEEPKENRPSEMSRSSQFFQPSRSASPPASHPPPPSTHPQ